METFFPHGICLHWHIGLMFLHTLSDLAIACAYFLIPCALLYVLHKRHAGLLFQGILGWFAAFIVLCGLTHLANILEIWTTAYWLSGTVKALTAVVSLVTALKLLPVVVQIVHLQSRLELSTLQADVAEVRTIITEELSQRLSAIITALEHFTFRPR